MPLHEGCLEGLGEDAQVALRAGRSVEHRPGVDAVGPSDQPARQAVGEAPGPGQRLLPDRSLDDLEAGALPPRRQVGTRVDDRPEDGDRSEEQTPELQSLMRKSYA